MIKNYIIIGLLSILIVFCFVISIKCARLEHENMKLKLEYTDVIDSIKIENEILEKDISTLSNQITKYEFKIDSLKRVKQKVIVEYGPIISEDLTEGVELLKENLRCEKYY